MKYRKKPVVVEAEQWFPGKDVDGVVSSTESSSLFIAPDSSGVYDQVAFIETLEGRFWIFPGDYIITGVKGEKYPCKPEIFELTYEKLENGEFISLTQSFDPKNALREMLDIQLQDGHWNYDEYMHGMANGMILMMAMLEGDEPIFKSIPPEGWLVDNPSGHFTLMDENGLVPNQEEWFLFSKGIPAQGKIIIRDGYYNEDEVVIDGRCILLPFDHKLKGAIKHWKHCI